MAVRSHFNIVCLLGAIIRERWAGVWKLESKLSAEQILHSNLKQRKWSIGHVAIRKFHASLTQSSCLSSPDWTLFCPRTLRSFHNVPTDVFFIYIFFIPFRAFQYFNQFGHSEILRLLRALCNQTSIVALGPDTCGLLRVAGWPAGRGAPCWREIQLLLSWTCSGLLITLYMCILMVHTQRRFRRCRWLRYFPKSSASCRSRASAPSTGRGTAPGSSPVSWSYPCSPPRRWNPEGSSPWCHPGPPGMWEEVVRVAVVGCGHPGTSVRTELRTASAPAPALMKSFWSMSSFIWNVLPPDAPSRRGNTAN